MNRPLLLVFVGLVVALAAVVLVLSLSMDEGGGGIVDSVPREMARDAPAQIRQGNIVIAPSFDVVRVGGDGSAVLAGRAEPSAEVVILDDDKEIGRVIADARGEWVFVPEVPLPPGSRTLALRATGATGTMAHSVDPVVLVVPDRPEQPTIALRVSPDGKTTLLQGPAPDNALLSVDLVERAPGNQLLLTGRARENGLLRLYLDNRFLGEVAVERDTAWRILTDASAEGDVLRVDMLNAAGKVIARIEIAAALQTAPPLSDAQSVRVEKGNSLWRIATRIYGQGEAYTTIYAANKDHIRNPNLIYPGQIFNLPPLSSPAPAIR